MDYAIQHFQKELKVPTDYHEYEPNLLNSYICAGLSKLAYKEAVTDEGRQAYKGAVKNTLKTWGWTEEDANRTIFLNSREIPKENERNYRPGTQGVIIFYEDIAFISFRGSEKKLNDWLTDFNLNKVNSPYILPEDNHNILDTVQEDILSKAPKIHRGFFEAFESLRPLSGDAHEYFQEVVGKISVQNHIWLTGHSLGGALALVATHYLLHEKIPVSGVYTFGTPRVGNRSYREYMNRKLTYKCWRFANNHDLVADVPLPRFLPHVNILAGGFSREGSMFRLTEQGYQVLRRVQEDGRVNKYYDYKGFSAKDHSMTTYMERIYGLVQQRYQEQIHALVFDPSIDQSEDLEELKSLEPN
jgi:predicted lipase